MRRVEHPGHQIDNGHPLCYGHALAHHHARRLAPPGLSQRWCVSYRSVLVEPGEIYLIVTCHGTLNYFYILFSKGVIWFLLATVAGVLQTVSLTSFLSTDPLFHSHSMSRSLSASI